MVECLSAAQSPVTFRITKKKDKGANYYLLSVDFQLEDDVVAKSGYYDEMKAYATNEASKSWLYLEFSQLGFIGVLLCKILK